MKLDGIDTVGIVDEVVEEGGGIVGSKLDGRAEAELLEVLEDAELTTESDDDSVAEALTEVASVASTERTFSFSSESRVVICDRLS